MPQTITAYTFDELSPEAQERALSKLPYDECEYSMEEARESLLTFAKTTYRLRDWRIGDSSRSFTRWDIPERIAELSGPRAFAWIENNIFEPIRQPWNLRDKSRRYYRPGTLKACPYTGVCFDEEILGAFRDRDPRLTIGERFSSIGDRLTRVIESDIEYQNSEEGRRERAEFAFEGVLFDDDGNRLRA